MNCCTVVMEKKYSNSQSVSQSTVKSETFICTDRPEVQCPFFFLLIRRVYPNTHTPIYIVEGERKMKRGERERQRLKTLQGIKKRYGHQYCHQYRHQYSYNAGLPISSVYTSSVRRGAEPQSSTGI